LRLDTPQSLFLFGLDETDEKRYIKKYIFGLEKEV
jgi:hypothetical protein